MASSSSSSRVTNLLPRLRGEALFGVHSVEAALRANSRHVHRLHLVDKFSANERLREVHALAERLRVPVEVHNKGSLNTLLPQAGGGGSGRHQGCVLDAAPLRVPEADSLEHLQHADAVVLALDELADPQNVGGLLRSAQFLGVDAVVLSAKNTAPLSPAVSRASAGALEELAAESRVLQARQMPRLLEQSRRRDGWLVVGTALSADAVAAHELRRGPEGTVLVMGSEGAGLRTNVRRACDQLVVIPPRSAEGSGVDSLNVAACGAVLMHALVSGPGR